ncbi:MAG TPA: hypothetical protein VNP04_04865 [Alphaproteobacteria bacterium]|nr:hypothetical protein [Alphaproteobacteria bacterium]
MNIDEACKLPEVHFVRTGAEVPTAAAIADAVGVGIDTLPITAEKVLHARCAAGRAAS